MHTLTLTRQSHVEMNVAGRPNVVLAVQPFAEVSSRRQVPAVSIPIIYGYWERIPARKVIKMSYQYDAWSVALCAIHLFVQTVQ
jgi:hypothetical protein